MGPYYRYLDYVKLKNELKVDLLLQSEFIKIDIDYFIKKSEYLNELYKEILFGPLVVRVNKSF